MASPLNRILIIRTDRMGDLLMNLPVFHALRTHFPDAHISLLMDQGLIPLLEDHPDLDQLIGWDPESGKRLFSALRLAQRLRPSRFDCVLVMHPVKVFHWAVWLAHIPCRVGYRRKWGFLLTHSLPDRKSERSELEAIYNLELLAPLGITQAKLKCQIPVSSMKRRQVDQLFKNSGLSSEDQPIAVHPWSSNSQKSWPEENFLKVLGQLKERQSPVAIIGGPEEQSQMKSLALKLPQGIINWVGKVPLGQLPGLLQHCSGLLSNDSGPVHVAAAVGTPTVIVAPASHEKQLRRWQPLGSGHTLLIDPSPEQVLQTLSSPPHTLSSPRMRGSDSRFHENDEKKGSTPCAS